MATETTTLARDRADAVSRRCFRAARRQPGGRGAGAGLWALEARDIRDSATDRHRSVDDTPAGGGPGMVMRADVMAPPSMRRISSPQRPPAPADEPRGRPLTQSRVVELAAGPGPLIVCGRFEGIDQRVIDARGARGGLDRRLCAVRRRNRRHGADRCLCPAAAGRNGKAGVRGR